MDSRGVVAKAWNDEDNIMQDLSALPELRPSSIVNSNVSLVGHNLLQIQHQ